jgi:5-methyltetrahydrofolate--homocysteine methyltransferase
MEQILNDIHTAIWEHDAKRVKALVEQAVAEKIDPGVIVNEGLVGGMNKLGEKFKSGEVFIPEILVSARAMAAGMAVVKPLLVKAGIKEKGIFVIGTVKEDLHDIGKNLVIVMLEGAGYKVIDLGINVSPEKFVQAIEEHKPAIVGMSALLTTTMTNMKEATAVIKTKHPGVKVIVGGAPVTQKFADAIGADAYASDGAVAVEKANLFMAA